TVQEEGITTVVRLTGTSMS
nr:immunoglobulin heavy chain junction region [Mus musculus]